MSAVDDDGNNNEQQDNLMQNMGVAKSLVPYSRNEILRRARLYVVQCEHALAIRFFERALQMGDGNQVETNQNHNNASSSSSSSSSDKEHKKNSRASVLTELAACLIETLDERAEVRARKLLDESIRLEPACVDGWQKYMLLGQLTEGKASVAAFSRGVSLLRKAHEAAKNANDVDRAERLRDEIAQGCSSAAEVYMTDLCMEDDAETQCEALLNMALRVKPTNIDALLCAASFRISQQRPKLARELIMRAYSLWRDIDNIDELPPYHVRVTAAKLMLELREPELALAVLRRLAIEADDVLEVWHLMCVAHEFLDEAQQCALCVSFALTTCSTMDADLPERQQFEPFFQQTRQDLAKIGVQVPNDAMPSFLGDHSSDDDDNNAN